MLNANHRISGCIANESKIKKHKHSLNPNIQILESSAPRQCVRVVKEMDSKSIGLCPQGFESPRCRLYSEYLVPSPHRLVVKMWRCGRNNSGSTPVAGSRQSIKLTCAKMCEKIQLSPVYTLSPRTLKPQTLFFGLGRPRYLLNSKPP